MPKLTDRTVRAARAPEDGYRWLWDEGDGAVKGFGLRVWRSGRKVFVFQYRDARGRVQRIRLGEYPATTTEQARELARTADTDAGAAKLDPMRDPAVRRNAQRASERAPTVSDLAALFLADRKRSAKPRTLREYRRLVDVEIVPTIGRLRVNDVDDSDIEALMAAPATKERAAMEDRPVIANNVRSLLHAMFTYAIAHRIRANGRNPCTIVTRYPTKSPKRSLTRDQYAALGAALDRAERDGLPVPPALKQLKHGLSKERRKKLTGRKRGPYKLERPERVEPANPVAVAVLRFLALSGWREGEALSLRRDAINRERGVAVLQDSKTGRSVRPLGEAALAIIDAQTPVVRNPYVFVGKESGQHLKEIKRVWTAARHASGVHVRLHDLRHSFTTVGRELGYSDYVIAKLVGHVLQGQTSRYGDAPDETVKAAADRVAMTIAIRLSGLRADVLPLVAQSA